MIHEELPAFSYPLYAPLPLPVVDHLFKRPVRDAGRRLTQSWEALAQQIHFARRAAYLVMHPYVLTDSLTTAWLLARLKANSPAKTPVGTANLSLWYERGLLRYERHGRPEVDNAAALLIARMVDPRERNWLPSTIEAGEPHWWCWRQDTPQSAAVPCPVPLPDDLTSTALLWTPWAGAAWLNRHWLSIGSLGSVRWARTARSRKAGGEHWSWAISRDDLACWDQEVTRLPFPEMSSMYADEIGAEVLQAQSTLILYRLALQPGRLGMFMHPLSAGDLARSFPGAPHATE